MKNFATSFSLSLLLLFVMGTAKAQETLTNRDIISLVTVKMAPKLIIAKIQGSKNNFLLGAAEIIALKNEKVSDPVIEEMLLACTALPVVKNDDVIQMTQAGVSKKIILKKIGLSGGEFNTSTDALIALKTAKVEDAVINAMMTPSARTSSTDKNVTASRLEPHPQDLPAPAQLPASGIYYEAYSPAVSYIELEPTTTNQSRSGGFGESIANHYSLGLSGNSTKVGLSNPSANLVIEDARPVFYFYVERDGKSIDEAAESTHGNVASPNDFVLVRAIVNKRGREVETARQNRYGKESGFTKGTVPFKFKKVSDRLYKVWFETDVPAGEYAFYYNKGSEQRSSLKLYDFSLRNNINLASK